jgi:hypothetical protein
LYAFFVIFAENEKEEEGFYLRKLNFKKFFRKTRTTRTGTAVTGAQRL